MFLDRRTFTAGSVALLSGCATVGARPSSVADCSPLVPVKVDASRVIRTMAGLRPYRRQGFVVRAEALGEKRLVHNYGHGGGGITLSWGTSKLATELGLQGHSGPGRGSRLRSSGSLDRATGAGGRIRCHDLRRRPSAGHDVERRRGSVPPVRRVSRGRRHAGVHVAIHPRARLQLAALSRSWSATITESAGFQPMSRPTARKRRSSPTSRR